MIAPDWTFIDQLEGFETLGYVPRDAAGEPLGKSGVTIGEVLTSDVLVLC